MLKKRKKEHSTIGLPSSQVEGQGTTNHEFEGKQTSSARKKTKK